MNLARKNMWRALSALMFCLLTVNPVRAASILWNTPTLISADTDVSITGTLLYAYTFGDTGGLGADVDGRAGSGMPEAESLSSATVNGVVFAPFEVPYNTSTPVTVGSVSLAINTANKFYSANTIAGSALLPFRSLSSPYQTLLESGVSTFQLAGVLTLTLGGLTQGQSYAVQLWSNDSDRLTNLKGGTTYTAGNAVTLDNNNLDTAGGVGQWVIGSFTADTTTEVLTIQSSTPATDYPVINGLQVRAVPEPSSVVLLLAGAALGVICRTVRKANKVA